MKLDSWNKVLAAAAIAVFGLTAPACSSEKAAPPSAAAEGEKAAPAPAADATAGKPAEAATPGPNAPVAVVNGVAVTRGEFDRAMGAYMRNFAQMTGGMHGQVQQPNDQMKSDVLDQLVDRELLYQESRKHPVEGADAKVEEELKAIVARFPDQATFEKALEGDGLTQAALRDLIGRQVSVREYVETKIMPDVKVADADVEAFYKENEAKFATPEQVQCSHILIRSGADAKPEEKEAAKKKAQDLQVRCVKGEDFGALAKEFSEDPGSASRGGDLGFFTREQMVAPFSEAAFKLKEGEVSGVVETQFGYHVIKLSDRKDASTRSLDEVRDQLREYLKSQAVNQAVQAKVNELKAVAKIDVVAPHL